MLANRDILVSPYEFTRSPVRSDWNAGRRSSIFSAYIPGDFVHLQETSGCQTAHNATISIWISQN